MDLLHPDICQRPPSEARIAIIKIGKRRIAAASHMVCMTAAQGIGTTMLPHPL